MRRALAFTIAWLLLLPAISVAQPSSERTIGRDVARMRADGSRRVPVRLYRFSRPWSNRDLATLESLGLREGVGYVVEPLAALREPVPDGTRVVVLSSNSNGSRKAAAIESEPGVQRTLARFLHRGGVVLASLADNLREGGYTLPRAEGTPRYIFPRGGCRQASLTRAAIGPDLLARTADDHPLVRGPDGIAGTHDDLTDDRIDLDKGSCYIAHGNLVDGITLPKSTTYLMRSRFRSGMQPILGEYCVGRGKVVASTLTLEYQGQHPDGNGPSANLRNVFAYALTGGCH